MPDLSAINPDYDWNPTRNLRKDRARDTYGIRNHVEPLGFREVLRFPKTFVGGDPHYFVFENRAGLRVKWWPTTGRWLFADRMHRATHASMIRRDKSLARDEFLSFLALIRDMGVKPASREDGHE